ncbi:beta-lactamase-like protein [Bacillus freudenreichii]|nr:beta-lactamase-like protein [Bacillus freudenreichii]
MLKIPGAWFAITEIDHITFAISEYGLWAKDHFFLLIGKKKPH